MKLDVGQEAHEMIFTVPVPEAVGDELPFGHVVEPVEFSARMLSAVESREPMDAAFQLGRQGKGATLLERPRTTGENLEEAYE